MIIWVKTYRLKLERCAVVTTAYSRKRGIQKKSHIQNASSEAVYKAEFPRYVRYADTYSYEVRVCPATSAYRLRIQFTHLPLSIYAEISHMHGEFHNYSKARTTPHEGCRKKYGNRRSRCAVDYARLLYEIAGELHRFAQKF